MKFNGSYMNVNLAGDLTLQRVPIVIGPKLSEMQYRAGPLNAPMSDHVLVGDFLQVALDR